MKNRYLVMLAILATSADSLAQQSQVTGLPTITVDLPPADTNADSELSPTDMAPFQFKWIVRSVQRDGKPNPAQIGQKVDDVITFERKQNIFEMG